MTFSSVSGVLACAAEGLEANTPGHGDPSMDTGQSTLKARRPKEGRREVHSSIKFPATRSA
mgnify:FL=1|jgi:hypothetical protein